MVIDSNKLPLSSVLVVSFSHFYKMKHFFAKTKIALLYIQGSSERILFLVETVDGGGQAHDDYPAAWL